MESLLKTLTAAGKNERWKAHAFFWCQYAFYFCPFSSETSCPTEENYKSLFPYCLIKAPGPTGGVLYWNTDVQSIEGILISFRYLHKDMKVYLAFKI